MGLLIYVFYLSGDELLPDVVEGGEKYGCNSYFCSTFIHGSALGKGIVSPMAVQKGI